MIAQLPLPSPPAVSPPHHSAGQGRSGVMPASGVSFPRRRPGSFPDRRGYHEGGEKEEVDSPLGRLVRAETRQRGPTT